MVWGGYGRNHLLYSYRTRCIYSVMCGHLNVNTEENGKSPCI
jgi:hypothetical protein